MNENYYMLDQLARMIQNDRLNEAMGSRGFRGFQKARRAASKTARQARKHQESRPA